MPEVPAPASSTALVIASSMVYLATESATAHLVPPESLKLCQRLLLDYSPQTRLLHWYTGNRVFRALVRGLEATTIPGIIEHYARRKVAITTLARAAISGGAGQLIVLGNGFDTLCARMVADFPGLRALTIDHPHTQYWYLREMHACGLLSAEMHAAALDLGQPGDLEQLGNGYIEPVITNFWVAEGLLMYFTEPQVRAVFKMIRAHSPPGSQIAFTYLEPDDQGRPSFHRRSSPLRFWLGRVGEPFRWGIRREGVADYLAELGFRPLETPSGLLAEVERLGVGEHIALAEVC